LEKPTIHRPDGAPTAVRRGGNLATPATHHGLVTFVLTPEAEEWRKTRALLEASPH